MTKKVSVIGLFTAMALLLSCIENMLPFRTGIPGIKLGIANLIIVIIFYFLPSGEVLSISLLRVFFLSVFSGSPFTTAFSFTGAITSFFAMYISYRRNSFSPVGISIIGGVTHNLAQLLISTLLLNTPAFLWYSPVLLISGIITGLINGLIAIKIIHTVKGMKW
ncbi:Gx transporter family protein [Dialister invisus]|uniref:Gx transporter family protein n=1 Tax=Dialister invisus TaxID=218538 RepID=UPI0026712505|nr:Gx transporter family protein [Dialister invisus]